MAAPAIANRRTLERIPVNRSVEMTTARAANDFFEATVTDFSENGVRVFTRRMLSKGERVIVHWGQRRLVGIVVYCRPESNGLTAGINLSMSR
jgi:hypothetical protein